MDFETFVQDLPPCYTAEDIQLLRKAYHLAEAAHAGQVRLSGDPYISHPLAVAKILADLRLDPSTLVTGILHDTVEDTSVRLEDLERSFGKTVSELVDGVTKVPEILTETSIKKQADNFRKLILCMAKDIRVILVKLADRLSNMRTLQHMNPEKQIKKAQETLEIYAPLANRLGIYWMKEELEDLSFQYLYPDPYQLVQAKIEKIKPEIQKVFNTTQIDFLKKLSEYGISSKIQGKIKHAYTLYKKMEWRQTSELEKMEDLFFFEILVENITECYKSLGVLHSHYKPIPGKFKDYIAMPKLNGYQSLHTTVVSSLGGLLELQIRTQEMQEVCYRGITAQWSPASWQKTPDSPKKMETPWIDRLLEWDQDFLDPNEFLKTLKIDLFPEDVFVFTPQGDLKQLPFQSTVIDFAYAVHTSLGHQCIGARVNGKTVPLKTILKSGDRIEILTSSASSPSFEWLKFARSSKAKAKISKWFRNEIEPADLPHASESEREEKFLLSALLFLEKKVRLASCCYPVPGKPVVAFQQSGNRLVLHLPSCSASRESTRAERKTSVFWDIRSVNKISFRLKLEFSGETPETLLSLHSFLIKEKKGNLLEFQVQRLQGFCLLQFKNLEIWKELWSTLQQLPKITWIIHEDSF